MMNERSSLNMYQSGESLMRMSPPSLVSSLMMESSGNFNPESLEGRKSMPSNRDSGMCLTKQPLRTKLCSRYRTRFPQILC